MRLIKNAFSTGEISGYSMGRTDYQGQSGNKYDHACESLQNFIPLIQGGAQRRPGTLFVSEAASTTCRLIPFRNLTTNGYVLEFTPSLLRFYKNDGIILSASTTINGDQTLPAGTITVSSTSGFASSGTIIINGENIAYTGKTGTTFTGCTKGVGVALDGTIVGQAYSITSPFVSGDLKGLKFTQIGDVMYIVSPNHPPQKLSHAGDTSWTISSPAFQPPPTHDFDSDYSGGSINLTFSVTAAGTSGTATASGNVWLAGDVGRFIVVGTGIAYISAYSSATVVNITVIDTFASASAAAGTWFVRGAPSSIICVGFIIGGKFLATSQFGPSNQPCYAFSSYPVNDTDPTSPAIYQDTWRAADLGRYMIFGGCVAQITLVTDAHSIVVQIINSVITTSIAWTNPANGNSSIIMQAQTGGTWTLEDPCFSAGNGYPRAVCFFQDRLCFAGTSAQPQNVWMSQSGDYENFAKGAQDSDAIDEEINSGFREQIMWLAAYQGQIAAGTPESEYILTGGGVGVGGNGPALTPTNFSAAIQSRYGVADIQPLFVESRLLYIQKALQTTYEFAYDIYQGTFGSKNLNLLHNIITTAGFKEVAYGAVPYRLLCFTTNNGNLVALTYNREQDVWAWSRHYTGQDLSTPDKFASVASIPNASGLADQFWFAVNRTINGVLRCYVEVLDSTLGVVAGDSASQQTFNPATKTLSGLGYLLGRTVWLNCDGAVVGPFTITSTGQLTLQIAASSVQVALPEYSQILTVRPEIQGAPTVQGSLKNWTTIWVRLFNTVGVQVNGSQVYFRAPSDNMGQGVPVPVGGSPDVAASEGGVSLTPFGTPIVYNYGPTFLTTFDVRVQNLGYDRDGRVLIQQLQPLPCTVLAMFGSLQVGQQ